MFNEVVVNAYKTYIETGYVLWVEIIHSSPLRCPSLPEFLWDVKPRKTKTNQ